MKEQILKSAQDWVQSVTRTSSSKVLDPLRPGEIRPGYWSNYTGELKSKLPVGIYTVDIETCRLSDDYWVPFCAVIYDWQTEAYWYWVSRDIQVFLDLPIEVGSTIIGHNICGYDRQYFSNEYTIQPPFEYLDTMGLAQRIRGISSQQIPAYKLRRGDWVKEFKSNSLNGLCNFYLDLDVDKSIRDDFTKRDWPYYRSIQKEILAYCARDVWATSLLFQKLWAESLESFHPLSLRAMALLSKTRLPLDSQDLKDYVSRVDKHYAQETEEVDALLQSLKTKVYREIVEPWMQGRKEIRSMSVGYQYLDWDPAKTGKAKGQPAWYRKCKNVTLLGHLAPVFLGVKYQGDDVYWHQGSWCAGDSKIPHPEGKSNLGQIFNKHFWDLLGDQLVTDDPDCYPALLKIKNLQFWNAFQSRVKNAQRFTTGGIHIPDYKPWGTVSGRGSDKLWLVSPSPKKESPGSELRSLVKAPEGWRIVGGDFASQEMRIFALLGDSVKGRLGSSDLSRLLLADGDIHTALSERSGAPRKICKNINYGAIYGLGLKSAEIYCKLAKMPSPRKIAQTVLDNLKGSKLPNGFFGGGLASQSFNAVTELMRSPHDAISPILGNKISKSLRTLEFAPSRQNWYVQTSGCDLRDLVVCSMSYLMPSVSLMLFIHDEPRYLVPDSLALESVEALQESHKFAIETMAEALGLKGLPDSFLYFDCVEVDTVWRKSATDDCLTPTQLDPIPPGQEYKRKKT